MAFFSMFDRLSDAKIKRVGNYKKGFATVEAAISMYVFLVALLTLVSLLVYPTSYRMIGMVITDTARIVSQNSYVARLAGATLLNNLPVKYSEQSIIPHSQNLDHIFETFNSLSGNKPDSSNQMAGVDIYEFFQLLSADKNKEQSTIAVNKGFEILVENIATWRLRLGSADSAKSRSLDPWLALGVVNGIHGMDFSGSRFDAETNKISIKVTYLLKPLSIIGLAPAIRCVNRVDMVLWGEGVGQKVREDLTFPNEDPKDEVGSDNSLWNHGDTPKERWNRGNKIESSEIERISRRERGKGYEVDIPNNMQRGYDMLTFSTTANSVKVWQIFSLNALMDSYKNNPTAVRRKAEAQLKNMPVIGSKVTFGSANAAREVRELLIIVVVPENSPVWLESLESELNQKHSFGGSRFLIVRGYGDYNEKSDVDINSVDNSKQ